MARFEANRFRSPIIEVEHLLLGFLRADVALAVRVFGSRAKVEEIRERVERETPQRNEATSTSVDIPLSGESKDALTRATEEASRLGRDQVAAEHLLLGILKQKKSVAARVLNECGVNLWQIEEESQRIAARTAAGAQASAQRQQSGRFPDLVAEGHAGTLGLVIGRERELEHLIQILSRKTKNSAILVGEPGAGKDSIVRALAQRIANSAVPAGLANRQILVVDRADLVEAFALSQVGGPILYVRGLFEARDAVPGLTHYLKRGQLQVMTTGTTVSFRLALEKADEAARNFEVVSVLPPTDDEAFAILTEVKEQFERFHGVIVFPDAVRTAVSASGRFLRHRVLPDRALDLIDDACALLKLRRFGNRLELKAADVVEAIAFRTSLTPDAVRAALERPETPDRADRMRRELAAGIPAGRQDWVDGLSAYLADCSDEEAQRLIEGIRSAKRKFDQPI